METEGLLNVSQAAALLNVSRGTVYRLAKEGEIPSVRLGKVLRIPRRALLAHIERLAAEAVAGATA